MVLRGFFEASVGLLEKVYDPIVNLFANVVGQAGVGVVNVFAGHAKGLVQKIGFREMGDQSHYVHCHEPNTLHFCSFLLLID